MKRRRFSSFYLKYLTSEQWQEKRKKILARAGYRCESCRRDTRPLHVHHKTYKNLGHEHLSELQALCIRCHRKADRMRRQR